jgi:hypothetical protein
VACGFVFDAALGLLAGVVLAIPAADVVADGRPVILGSVGLGRRSRL